MDAILQIKQAINALESSSETQDADVLYRFLSDFDKGVNPQDIAVGTIVKMMLSITKYLSTKSGTPHPEALRLLAVFGSNLEAMVGGSPALDANEVKTTLDQCIQDFKSLKTAISAPPSVSDAEFETLKAVILSVDWEISSLTLENFDNVISELKARVKANKVHFTFLRIMHSLGGYIARNGSNANNDSISLLQAVFEDYEALFLNPDMPMPEKKGLIERNISKYKAFKAGLTANDQSGAVSPAAEEDMSPALSHIGSSAVSEGDATLNVLSETDEPAGTTLKARAPGKKQTQQPRDVMGDLFSPKTTPADELLDAIHLSELHGSEGEGPTGMMPPDPAQQTGDGVKNFTPERGRNEPIPEIASRLDEFFNLDISDEGSSDASLDETTPKEAAADEIPSDAMGEWDEDDEDIQPGLSGLIESGSGSAESLFGTDGDVTALEDDDDDDSLESLVPTLDFTSEDGGRNGKDQELLADGEDAAEIVQEDADQFLDPELPELDAALMVESLEEDDPAESVLVRLKNLLNAPAGLADNGPYTQAMEDIGALDQMWASDQTKRMLLDIMSGLVTYVYDSAHNEDERLVPSADSAGKEDDGTPADPFFENIELDEEDDASIYADNPETPDQADVTSQEQAGADELSVESVIDEGDQEDQASYDDGFQPEEVESSSSKPKRGLFGKLMAKFRK